MNTTIPARTHVALWAATFSVVAVPLLGQEKATAPDESTAQVSAPLDQSRLTDCDLHVIGIYMPQNSSADDRVYVEVKATEKPIVVALTSYNSVQWHLKIDPKARVQQIIIAGYFEQGLAEPHPDIPIVWQTYFPTADKKNKHFFWADGWHTREGRNLRKKLNELTGLDVTTFQAEYQGSRFVIDGKKGIIADADNETQDTANAASSTSDDAEDFVEILETYVSKLRNARSTGRLEEAEKLEDYVRYLLLSIRIHRDETNKRLMQFQQTLGELDDNENSDLKQKLRAEMRKVEDLLAIEEKYTGFLPPRKSAFEPISNRLNSTGQRRYPWSLAEEYVRLELVKAKVEDGTLTAEYGADHPKLIQVRGRVAILEKELLKLAARTAEFEAEAARNSRRLGPPPGSTEIGQHVAADRSRVEVERQLSAVRLEQAESAAAAAAANHRAELAREQPAKENLKRLREALQREVTRAFEFRMALQQHRLQLAEMDLQQVKTQQQRRQALAAKIIERRVEELVSGADLSWPANSTSDVGRPGLGDVAPASVADAKVSTNTTSARSVNTPRTATQSSQSLIDDWLKNARSLGDDAEAKRDKVVAEIKAALAGDNASKKLAAAKALGQLADVNFDKSQLRQHLLELCQSANGETQVAAFYALYNTDRKDDDVVLLQTLLSRPHAAVLDRSASHLLHLFGESVIDEASEKIVLQLLDSPDRDTRREVLRGLWGSRCSETLMARVVELAANKESRNDAIYFGLSTWPNKNEAVVDELIEVLSDPDWNNWSRAIWGLGYGVSESQKKKVAEAMLQMHEFRSDPQTREKCQRLINKYGDARQIARLRELVGNSSARSTATEN